MCVQACRDFLDLAETHSRRWQRALQYEREQRSHLEQTIEQLAKQHNSLERAWREAPAHTAKAASAPTPNTGKSTAPSPTTGKGPAHTRGKMCRCREVTDVTRREVMSPDGR